MNEGFVDRFIQSFPDRQPGVALDIGAHAGTFAVVMAHKFERVFAFEPHPDNIATMTERVAKYPNIQIVEAAVSDKPGRTKLYTNSNVGAHTIDEAVMSANWGHNAERFITVDTIVLDDFCVNFLDQIRLIKVDIEGAEAFIFKGARKLLACRPGPIIILELHNIPEAAEDIYHQFADIGYTFNDECDRNNIYPLAVDKHYIIRRPCEGART